MESTKLMIPVSREVRLEGDLTLPDASEGLVIFAHGSGSSRFSPRNRQTAAFFHTQGIGTLLFDLLTPEEAGDATNVFDLPLLAKRLKVAARYLQNREDCARLPFGLFGASTGGGAALWAAPEIEGLAAIVSRGGRPDLAGDRLRDVRVPTLLIVGGNDLIVLALNRQAARAMPRAKLLVIPGATHLFEEAGAMEQVEQESTEWFLEHFKVSVREVA